jgi:AcrR family transcriptional regulator
MKSPDGRAYTMRARDDAVSARRESITRAALQLFLERAYEDVTLYQIAAAAGVSHQTVLNHFESKEGVAFAAAEVLKQQTGAQRGKARPGDVRGAVRILVEDYERTGDANARWAMSPDRLGRLAALLEDARAGHQAWIQYVFADSLPSSAVARRRAVNALHAATDVYTWKLLRRDLRLSRAETEKIMVDLVSGVLGARPGAT